MMQDRCHEKRSRLRAALLALLEHLRKILEVTLARTPLVKGYVYEIARAPAGQLHLHAWPVAPQHGPDLAVNRGDPTCARSPVPG